MEHYKVQLLFLAAGVLLLAANAPTVAAQDRNVTGAFVETPPASPATGTGNTASGTSTNAAAENLTPVPAPSTQQPGTSSATGQPGTTPAPGSAGATNETAAGPNAAATEQEGEVTNMTTSRVDQAIEQPFIGVRSCLPFNILIAMPQKAAGTSRGNSSTGRILIEADYNVINSTVASVEDGILTLSLNGGFEAQQAINFTVMMPAGSELRYVANYGSGMVVLAPGHISSNIRLIAPTLGQIQATNLTAQVLTLVSSGVLDSSISGSFSQAEIITHTATGDVLFNSSTHVQLTVRISGITTVVADVPRGSSIRGTAGGLSKVQYVQGNCQVTSETPYLFPVPSIFGSRLGSALADDKCERVTPTGLSRLAAAAASPPTWTCGIIVDGALSCMQGNMSQPIIWNIQNVSDYQPSPPNAAGDLVAPTDDMYDPTRGTVIPTGPPPGYTPPTGANTPAATPSATSSDTQPPSAGGGARKLLQVLVLPAEPSTTQTTNRPGSINTGSFTRGPGTFASSSGTVGPTTQTTTSQEGSPPQTAITTGGVNSPLFNPIVVPATPPEAFSTDNATNATTAQTSTAVTPRPAAAVPTVSVRVSSTGPSGTAAGVAVVNTMCMSDPASLSMLSSLRDMQQGTAVTNTSTGSQASAAAVTPSAPTVPVGAQNDANGTAAAAATTANAGTEIPVVEGPGETTELTQNDTQANANSAAGAGNP